MKLEREKKQYKKSPDDKKIKLYSIHHMHHFIKVNDQAKHDLHHCFLFSKKDMKGKKYSIIHKMHKDKVYHCINSMFKGMLYDHNNNIFKIAPKKINNQTIYEIKL